MRADKRLLLRVLLSAPLGLLFAVFSTDLGGTNGNAGWQRIAPASACPRCFVSRRHLLACAGASNCIELSRHLNEIAAIKVLKPAGDLLQ